MFIKPLLILEFLLGSSVAVGAIKINLPVAIPRFDWSSMDPFMKEHMKPAKADVRLMTTKEMPKSCKDFANRKSLNPLDYKIFVVSYDDCYKPWIMCRHKDSPTSPEDMVEAFGRFPVRMRQYIAHVHAVPYFNDSTLAHYSANDVVVRGDHFTPTTLGHELSHALDEQALKNYTTGRDWFSDTIHWNKSIMTDDAVVTGYSRSTWKENFAETGIAGLFDTWVPGGLQTLMPQPAWPQVFLGVMTYRKFLGDTILPGGRCEFRHDDSEFVPMGDEEFWTLGRLGLMMKPTNRTGEGSVDDHDGNDGCSGYPGPS